VRAGVWCGCARVDFIKCVGTGVSSRVQYSTVKYSLVEYSTVRYSCACITSHHSVSERMQVDAGYNISRRCRERFSSSIPSSLLLSFLLSSLLSSPPPLASSLLFFSPLYSPLNSPLLLFSSQPCHLSSFLLSTLSHFLSVPSNIVFNPYYLLPPLPVIIFLSLLFSSVLPLSFLLFSSLSSHLFQRWIDIVSKILRES
jgi:hypothetical protein